MKDTDGDIADDDTEKQKIFIGLHKNDRSSQDRIDKIEQGKDIVFDDLLIRLRRLLQLFIVEMCLHALCDLFFI